MPVYASAIIRLHVLHRDPQRKQTFSVFVQDWITYQSFEACFPPCQAKLFGIHGWPRGRGGGALIPPSRSLFVSLCGVHSERFTVIISFTCHKLRISSLFLSSQSEREPHPLIFDCHCRVWVYSHCTDCFPLITLDFVWRKTLLANNLVSRVLKSPPLIRKDRQDQSLKLLLGTGHRYHAGAVDGPRGTLDLMAPGVPSVRACSLVGGVFPGPLDDLR